MRISKKQIIVFFISLFLIFCFFNLIKTPSFIEDTFIIKEGETLKTISKNLKEQGFISNSSLFYFTFYLTKDATSIKAGAYNLNSSLGIFGIIEQIMSYNTISEKITIIEGWTINDIALYLEQRGLFPKEDFINASNKDYSSSFPFLNDYPLEGFLFPDTYFINRTDTPETIIEKMLSNFEIKVLKDIGSVDNFYETLILSSILEREVVLFEDKQKVAYLLLKRLDAKMLLQVDATVLYANNNVFDSEIDSPFNTYKYLGLPPNPISNPGIESIKASLNPLSNNYWYYLSSKDGQTIFSYNFEEHKRNKALYLR
ncbi:MAG: endolytic transglycosylase MltG [Candidatus Pacebacteria bacterium]|nr:endolytic transglycosylase MltG [Candidatus Paceibacterota bacterium]